MNIVNAKKKNVFEQCKKFVIPFEKQCCGLMEKILLEDESVHALVDADEICGVISYSETGHGVLFCLPAFTVDMVNALNSFFVTRSVFCITGEANGADMLQKIVENAGLCKAREIRKYYFMEHTGNLLEQKKYNIVKCTSSDLKGLSLLHFGYMREEVVPMWQTIYKPGEMKSLEHILKTQDVFAVYDGKKFVAKAQTNARTENYFQVGGVYTMPMHRGKGYARELVNAIVEYGASLGKKTVLFVKEKNIPAQKAYLKAGFAVTGRNRIIYFLPSSTERL